MACETIPWWSWASNPAQWEAMYQRIHRLATPPVAGTKEYDWAKHQRRMYAKGRLARDRIGCLEGIKWWSWKTNTDARWEQRWQKINQLPQPPASTTREYHWVLTQKKRKTKGLLEPERIGRCEEIPWWSWA